jgi:hypothetical protein
MTIGQRVSIFLLAPPAIANSPPRSTFDGDKYLHDDFAFGTRDELIPRVERTTEAAEIHKVGLNKPFARIRFDLSMTKEVAGARATIVLPTPRTRLRASVFICKADFQRYAEE